LKFGLIKSLVNQKNPEAGAAIPASFFVVCCQVFFISIGILVRFYDFLFG
jgi:hypothetical protein